MSDEAKNVLSSELSLGGLRVNGVQGFEMISKKLEENHPDLLEVFNQVAEGLAADLFAQFENGLVVIPGKGEYGTDIKTKIKIESDSTESKKEMQKSLLELLNGDRFVAVQLGKLQAEFEEVMPNNLKIADMSPDNVAYILPKGFLQNLDYKFVGGRISFFASIDGVEVNLPSSISKYIQEEVESKTKGIGGFPINHKSMYEQLLVTWVLKMRDSES